MMDMNKDNPRFDTADQREEFGKFVEYSRQLGLKTAKLGGFEIEFWDRPTPIVTEQPLHSGPIPLMGDDEMPSDEAMLFAAVEDPDEIDKILKAAQKPETTP